MSNRIKTKYPGVYYRLAQRIGGKGTEKVYYVVFKKDGKMIEEKVGRQYADDLTEAKSSLIRGERIEGKRLSRKEVKDTLEAEKIKQQDRWTFSRLWDEYKTRKPSNKSLAIDDSRFNKYIEPIIGTKLPIELFQFEIDKLRVTLLKTKKPQTVKHVLALIRRISNFAVKKNLTEGISFDIELPPVNNNKTEDLSPSQMKSLIEAIEQEPDIQIAHFMQLALYTGMRRGEIFKLMWDDIDFERGFINIRDPKGGPDQKIPINVSARHVLENHPKTLNKYVFPDKNGKQRYQITRETNRIKERAGLPKDFRPLHGLRHVYASILASSGQVDMYTLQKLLTHKSPMMTQRYAHLRDETLKRASNLAGELIDQIYKENCSNIVKINEK